jgi:peptidyl-prolyl cis-trans isomerase C
MKKILVVLLPFFVFIYTSVFRQMLTAQADGEIIARINNFPITRKDLNEKVNLTINQTYFHKSLSAEKKRKVRKDAFNALIDEELLFQAANKDGIKIEKKRIDLQYEKVEGRFTSKQAFKAAMKRAGYTPKDLKKKIERDFLIKEVTKRTLIHQSVVSEEELKTYYINNLKKFKKPETVNLQLIYIKARGATAAANQEAKAKAEGLLKRIKEGEDFGVLAGKYSDDGYRIKGGRLGEVHRGRLPKEIDKIAFSMKMGDTSQLIKIQTGYCLIKLLDRKDSRQLEFEEIKTKLKKDLEKKRVTAIKKKWMAELKEQAKIEILIDTDEI